MGAARPHERRADPVVPGVVARAPVDMTAVLGDVRVLALVEIVVEPRGELEFRIVRVGPAPVGAREHGIDRARALDRTAVGFVLEAGPEAVDPGLVVGAVPFPEERRLVARVAKGLRLLGQVPERVLGEAEVEAGEPGPRLAHAGVLVEQAVLERKLKARGVAVAPADDEIHRLVFRQRRLGGGASAYAAADERLQRVGAARRHPEHEHARRAPGQIQRDGTGYARG